MSEADKAKVAMMNAGTGQAGALRIETVSVDADGVVARIPYDAKLVGDPDTGVIAGGVVTTLLDHACGMAVHLKMQTMQRIATLDLRIDYMRAAAPQKPIYAKAHCYKLTRSVAFVRALAYDETPDDPVAAAQSAFMIIEEPKAGS